ncbi:hypothetical protein OF376_00065 [Ureaplasma miroungigenitalium]|uniref:Uncharacterized protein n=1 Tax=Ureaplasma miroungigenitalium TaxID=1042321 RepID=A0ABT3BLN9_9BACT|nr:hypothetical protein [Ureaplasma miroungigenitalium]MCV3728184.1 hypothetical protein [Ureaplasma miroungigenitalium]MCV3733988.1 hypothetical protein [Ureaplasma miroungigenitalium]
MTKHYRKIIINTFDQSYTYPLEGLIYVNLYQEDTWIALKNNNASCLSIGTYKLVLTNGKELIFHLHYGLVYLFEDTIQIHTDQALTFYKINKKAAMAKGWKTTREAEHFLWNNLVQQTDQLTDDTTYVKNQFLIFEKYVQIMNQRLYLIADED